MHVIPLATRFCFGVRCRALDDAQLVVLKDPPKKKTQQQRLLSDITTWLLKIIHRACGGLQSNEVHVFPNTGALESVTVSCYAASQFVENPHCEQLRRNYFLSAEQTYHGAEGRVLVTVKDLNFNVS